MTSFNGSCHCGKTTWTVELPKDDGQNHILCHCDACKVLGGGEYTLNTMANKSDLKFTKGGESLGVYTYTGDSGKPVHCYYCPSCTAHPYHHQTALGDKVVIRTSLLQGGKKFPVAAEIYGKDLLSWQPKIAEKVFPEGPE